MIQSSFLSLQITLYPHLYNYIYIYCTINSIIYNDISTHTHTRDPIHTSLILFMCHCVSALALHLSLSLYDRLVFVSSLCFYFLFLFFFCSSGKFLFTWIEFVKIQERQVPRDLQVNYNTYLKIHGFLCLLDCKLFFSHHCLPPQPLLKTYLTSPVTHVC